MNTTRPKSAIEKGRDTHAPASEKWHRTKIPPFEKGGLGGIQLLTEHLNIWTATDTGQSGCSSAIVMALPPLVEQHRIVAKVDRLMAQALA